MKAWKVEDIYSYEGDSTIVFAETRGKARSIAMQTEECSESKFVDIAVTRFPEADKLYTEGKREVDWNDPKDRMVMVRDWGYYCLIVKTTGCDKCCAKKYCPHWEVKK